MHAHHPDVVAAGCVAVEGELGAVGREVQGTVASGQAREVLLDGAVSVHGPDVLRTVSTPHEDDLVLALRDGDGGDVFVARCQRRDGEEEYEDSPPEECDGRGCGADHGALLYFALMGRNAVTGLIER